MIPEGNSSEEPMQTSDKKSLQVALSLKYGVKKPQCCCCCHEELRMVGEMREEPQILCALTKEIVPFDGVCPGYEPPRLKGRRMEVLMFDEISPVPENHWRHLPS